MVSDGVTPELGTAIAHRRDIGALLEKHERDALIVRVSQSREREVFGSRAFDQFRDLFGIYSITVPPEYIDKAASFIDCSPVTEKLTL